MLETGLPDRDSLPQKRAVGMLLLGSRSYEAERTNTPIDNRWRRGAGGHGREETASVCDHARKVGALLLLTGATPCASEARTRSELIDCRKHVGNALRDLGTRPGALGSSGIAGRRTRQVADARRTRGRPSEAASGRSPSTARGVSVRARLRHRRLPGDVSRHAPELAVLHVAPLSEPPHLAGMPVVDLWVALDHPDVGRRCDDPEERTSPFGQARRKQ